MEEQKQNKLTLPGAIIIAGTLIAVTVLIKWTPARVETAARTTQSNTVATLADGGHILPLETEKKMLQTLTVNGSIDPDKLPQVTELNLLWAFGLANKNQVLETGPIMDMRYGGPTNMASVGGWTVTAGSVMDHYDKHALVTLTTDQQSLVEKIAKGIYRPCCNNSTHFPDCNHGMAMLGLLEYLAANGATEDQMWGAAISANIEWFSDQYQTIAQYLKEKGIDIKSISPQELLGPEYSSASGFARIASQVKEPILRQNSGGCGVESGHPADTTKKQSGCGV
jgi:hypothetical protein